MNTTDTIITTAKAMEISGFSRNTIKKYAREGKIRSYSKKLDRNMYFVEEEFRQDIAELEKLIPYDQEKS